MENLRVFREYFVSIAHEVGEKDTDEVKNGKGYFHENICREIDFFDETSALYAYLNGHNLDRDGLESLCFPFGLNSSQFKAVEQTFLKQVTVIQGPPGTGKTQTILNIIANAVIHNKSVAVVSPNNPATDNVFEKLEEYNFSFIAANLGNKEKRNSFFENVPAIPEIISSWNLDEEDLLSKKTKLAEKVQTLKEYLDVRNELGILKHQLREWEQEKKYFDQYFNKELKNKLFEEINLKRINLIKFDEHRQIKLITDLMMNELNNPSIGKKIETFFKYGIYNFKMFKSEEKIQALIDKLENNYYETKIRVISLEIIQKEKILEAGNYEQLMKDVEKLSIEVFKAILAQRYTFEGKRATKSNLFHDHKLFVDDFPVTLSTNDAICTNIQQGEKFDYVIMDEASMGGIMPSIFPLSVAKNIVIVGDAKQLPNIVGVKKEDVKTEVVNSDYDYFEHSILSSMEKVFKEDLPSTLLREHYRCHPMIINFCNKEFYNEELIIMKEASNEKSLVLLETSYGNHMKFDYDKKVFNQREIDSILSEEFKDKCPMITKMKSTAVITPFRRQVEKTRSTINKRNSTNNTDVQTVHKYQGRSCDAVIFSTVLDNKGSKRNFEFVENENLVNVAVSRAKELFVLNSSVEKFNRRNNCIASLIRYIRYYGDYSLEYKSGVRSIFDLLTKDFQEELESRKKKYEVNHSRYDSENIMMDLIMSTLRENKYHSIACTTEYSIKKLAKDFSVLNQEENQYVKNGARLDFLFYFKSGNEPIGAIEVDGHTYHSRPIQQEKDLLKDEILSKIGIPLERFSTTGSEEEKKLRQFLDRIIYSTV